MRKTILLLFLALTALSSAVAPTPGKDLGLVLAAEVIADGGFESGSAFPCFSTPKPIHTGGWATRAPCGDAVVQRVSSPVHTGNFAARIDTRTATAGRYIYQDLEDTSTCFTWTFHVLRGAGQNTAELVENWDRGGGFANVVTVLQFDDTGTSFRAWDAAERLSFVMDTGKWLEVTVEANGNTGMQTLRVDGTAIGELTSDSADFVPETIIMGDVSGTARHGLYTYDDVSLEVEPCPDTPTPTPTDTPTNTPTGTPTPTPTPSVKPKFDTLIGKIDALVGPPGLRTSLRSKLNTAERLAQGANPCASANVMGAFINQVQAQTSIFIPPDTASLLIAQAQNIIDQLEEGNNCPPNPPDADGDEMIDSAEVTLGTDPSNPDTDTDLVSDGLELLHTGTDPLDLDTDSNGTPDGAEDPDQDGCTTAAEVGPIATSGGLRDPLNFWDFAQQWVGVPPAKNGTVTVGDLGAVVARFGTFQGLNLTEEETIAEALTPPAATTGYHASADRAGSAGPNQWNLLPPNGTITVGDLGVVVVQFGHTCA